MCADVSETHLYTNRVISLSSRWYRCSLAIEYTRYYSSSLLKVMEHSTPKTNVATMCLSFDMTSSSIIIHELDHYINGTIKSKGPWYRVYVGGIQVTKLAIYIILQSLVMLVPYAELSNIFTIIQSVGLSDGRSVKLWNLRLSSTYVPNTKLVLKNKKMSTL